ncbi:hypothetical protein RBSH_01980 [Rhodopirellula baltica SH28]|uniref:Uncharacterized protein n=1 Tax=Rhodopirellula baltica SH28 TaxID=993517 RepID=K5D7G7_RHOBT|nr:hypothetical protein RBSH_01980 [Rhodopirellula baltica SH28]
MRRSFPCVSGTYHAQQTHQAKPNPTAKTHHKPIPSRGKNPPHSNSTKPQTRLAVSHALKLAQQTSVITRRVSKVPRTVAGFAKNSDSTNLRI